MIKMSKKTHDIFGPGSNFKERVFRDYNQLKEKISSCKQLVLKIVLTSGAFDLSHIGHLRYLERAKECGDVLVVGVDSNDKIKKRKGPHRPIVDEEERMEIICHSRHADLVFLKQDKDTKWHLIKTVQPDVLIVTKRVYKENDLVGLDEYCGEIKLLESQATTSTTAKIRRILISPVEEIKMRLREAVEGACSFLDGLTGDGGAS